MTIVLSKGGGTSTAVPASPATGSLPYFDHNMEYGWHLFRNRGLLRRREFRIRHKRPVSEVITNFTVSMPPGGSTTATDSPGGRATYGLALNPSGDGTFPDISRERHFFRYRASGGGDERICIAFDSSRSGSDECDIDGGRSGRGAGVARLDE